MRSARTSSLEADEPLVAAGVGGVAAREMTGVGVKTGAGAGVGVGASTGLSTGAATGVGAGSETVGVGVGATTRAAGAGVAGADALVGTGLAADSAPFSRLTRIGWAVLPLIHWSAESDALFESAAGKRSAWNASDCEATGDVSERSWM